MPDQITTLNPNGINKDISSFEVPDDKWTDGKNVYFDDNKTKKILGYEEEFGTPNADPYWLLYNKGISTEYWIYASTGKINKVDLNGTHTDLTRTSGDYTGFANNKWNGGVLGGVVILNNGVNDPQMLGSSASNFSDLSNWITGTCKVIRPFRRFLVALDTTESGTRYPFRVRWSHPAEGGTVPTTWDETDATKDAGYVDLSQSSGKVVDCLPLRDSNIIYKEDSVWSMNYVGGQAIFSFSQIFENSGILGIECVKTYENGHFVVGPNDIYIHNGQTRQSVVQSQIRKQFYSDLHPSYKDRTFVVANYPKNEMWVCIVSQDNQTGDSCVDKAYVWNWIDNSWAIRDLPHIRHAALGIVDKTSSYAWGSGTTWSSTTGAWNVPINSALVFADSDNTKLYGNDYTNTFNGTDFKAYVEKEDMSLGFPGNKSIKKIVPRLKGTGDVDVYVGSKFITDGGTAWQGPYTFTPGTHTEIPVRATGKYMGVRFESKSDKTWELDNLEIHWTPQGMRGNGV